MGAQIDRYSAKSNSLPRESRPVLNQLSYIYISLYEYIQVKTYLYDVVLYCVVLYYENLEKKPLELFFQSNSLLWLSNHEDVWLCLVLSLKLRHLCFDHSAEILQQPSIR